MICKCCGEEFTPSHHSQVYCNFCKYLPQKQRAARTFFNPENSAVGKSINYAVEWQKWKRAHVH